MQRIWRLLNIKPDEQGAVRVLAAYYFLITAAYFLGMAAAPSIFYEAFGEEAKRFYPLLTTINTVLVALLIPTFNRLTHRLPLNPLVIGSNLLFAGTLFLLQILLGVTQWASALMVPVVLSGFTIGQLQYYLIAGTIFDARQSKRILGLIGIGGGLAGILSGLAIRPLMDVFVRLFNNETLGAQSIILVAVILTAITALIVRQAQPFMRQPESPQAEESDTRTTKTASDKPIFDRYLLTLMVIIGAFILSATLADIQYRTLLAERYPSADDQTVFHGYYTAAAGAIQMVMRLFIVGPVLVNFGILAGLLALPIGMIFASSGVLIFRNVYAGTALKGIDQSLRFTLNETAVELGWVPVPPEQRLIAKPFVSGVFIAVVQGATGILVFGLNSLDFESVRILSGVILVVCLAWIPAVIALRRGYLNKLMTSIQDRSFDFEDLNIDTADSAIVQTIDRTLRNGTDLERAFVLDIIEDVRITPWAAALNHAFNHTENIAVRERILTLAARHSQVISDAKLLELIETPNDLTDEAIYAAGERGIGTINQLLMARLKSEQPEVRAAAARAILRLDQINRDEAITVLREMLRDKDDQITRYALDAVHSLPAPQAAQIATPSILRELLSRSPAVSLRTQDIIVHTHAPLIGDVVDLLSDSIMENKARAILRHYPEDSVRKVLVLRYTNPRASVGLRAAVSRTLNDYLNEDVVQIMIASLDVNNRAVYNEAVDTLLIASRAGLIPDYEYSKLEGHGLILARNMYSLYLALDSIQQASNEVLFMEMLQTDIDEATPTLLKLAVMDVPNTDIDSVINRLRERNPQIIGNVLEILDNVLSNVERSVIIPLFEDRPTDELSVIGRREFTDLDTSLADEIIYYINHGDDWQSAVALDYLLRHPEIGVQIGRDGLNISPHSRELIARHGDANKADTLANKPNGQGATMYSILEKTVLLKNSELFQDVNARDLYHIAQVTDDFELPAGESLFAAGDPADAMYIVANGKMQIHNGDRVIAELTTGSPIGEIALLDQQPRTASATALEDTHLLRITTDEFFHTVTTHTTISRSIMRLLAVRLRGMVNEHQTDPQA